MEITKWGQPVWREPVTRIAVQWIDFTRWCPLHWHHALPVSLWPEGAWVSASGEQHLSSGKGEQCFLLRQPSSNERLSKQAFLSEYGCSPKMLKREKTPNKRDKSSQTNTGILIKHWETQTGWVSLDKHKHVVKVMFSGIPWLCKLCDCRPRDYCTQANENKWDRRQIKAWRWKSERMWKSKASPGLP